ncbi:MAG: hypothetical protein Q8S27_06725, partial [Hoeflea sp.]|nr:hypothetical protein [Hoeflea sp.]
MTMSPELFMAILSMDSYNRGYNEGITGLGGVGSLVGAAEIISQSNVLIGSEDRDAGFYAVASQWNGERVISYRGTDNDSIWGNPWTSPSDICSGWPLGGGTRRPRRRHPGAPTKTSAATSLPL